MLREFFLSWRLRRQIVRCETSPNSTNIKKLLDLIVSITTFTYTPAKGLRHGLFSHYERFTTLTKQLTAATVIMQNNAFITQSGKKERPRQVILDDYFTDSEDRPVKPTECVKELQRLYANFLFVLNDKDDKRQPYYRRHFEHLENDILNLSLCLSEMFTKK